MECSSWQVSYWIRISDIKVRPQERHVEVSNVRISAKSHPAGDIMVARIIHKFQPRSGVRV